MHHATAQGIDRARHQNRASRAAAAREGPWPRGTPELDAGRDAALGRAVVAAMRRRVADLRRRLPPHGRAVADNASVRPPPPGTVLDGKYVLEASIGHGRFGTVYRARHVALQRPVALKLLHDAARLAAADFQQFRIEAEALARLDHPNIVTVLDFGIDPADGGLP